MPSMRYVISISCGVTTPYVPDYMVRPFNIGLGVTMPSSGTSTYNVEHTFDYTGSSAFLSSNAIWFQHSTLSALSSNANGNYAFPVSAIRLNVTANSSSQLTTMTLMQAG
jgi:hypothetical protein